MKKDIILSGVGGQGILTIATVIGAAALNNGLFIKQSEVHGMSQRGGDVQANLRISSKPVLSDLIPAGKADIIISIEPLEALRYLPMMNREKGWLITSSNPVKNIPDYPELENLLTEIIKLPNHIIIDAEKTAKEAGSVRAANIVILGAAAPFIGLEYEYIKDAIKKIFSKKGDEIVNMNLKALELGYQHAQRNS
jgi:indolepyruvate ferredoxin oxidoreductase beta subunit